MSGSNIRDLRRERGWSQVQLARELGLTPTYVGLMERGAKSVELRTDLAARYILDQYLVSRTLDGRYSVARRTIRENPSRMAMISLHGQTMLYGIFQRRDHAYRWVAALRSSKMAARATQKVKRDRAAQVAKQGPE